MPIITGHGICGSCSRLLTDVVGGLTDSLERIEQGKRQHLVAVQVRAAVPLYEADRVAEGLCHVHQADAVVRLHTAAPPSARLGLGNTGSGLPPCADQSCGRLAVATVRVRSRPS